MIIGGVAQGNWPIQQPRFGECDLGISPLGPTLQADAKLLSATGQAWPVRDVKISLRQLNKSDQTIDRAESGAEVKRTGPLFLDQKVKVLASCYASIDRKSVDLAKITKIFQALFGRLYSHRVENITRRDRHFTANHLVFRPRIAGDINAVNVGALALIDSIGQID